MRIEYISHSCFVIETADIKIVLDPWIIGTAYHGQWHLFPKPVNIDPVINADVILISHGHEDHMHHQSLKLINKNTHVFFPFQWREGVVDYFKHLKFKDITEAVSFKTYYFKNIKITYLGYSLESVVVVECEGKVIVNVNDALNSNHETAVDFLLKKIRTTWPKIDFLLSGWSGAGYFPNKVHYKTKDDIEVAKIREQYFADNFCRFVKHLQPDIALPFAPGFVLLNDENRWINEVKFPRNIVADYYHKNFENKTHIQFPITYPGDYFIDNTFHKTSKYHNNKDEKEIYKILDTEFKNEIVTANIIEIVDDKQIAELETKLKFWLNKNKTLYDIEVIRDAVFSIKFTDVKQNNYFNISTKGVDLLVKRSSCPAKEDKLLITTKAKLLSTNLDKMWGGDILTIGYALDVDVFEELSLEKNLDIVCARLITRYPIFKDDIKNHIGRAFKYYFNNPSLTNLWLTQKIKLKPYVNKYPFNERDHWITYNKCELCQVCKIPELDFEALAVN